MNSRRVDWVWALVVASGLLGAATFVILVIHPGGFEGQIGWFLALMPGAIVGFPLEDRIMKVAPSIGRIALWSLVIGITLLWYFAVSYAVVKTCRFFARAFR